MKCLQCHSSTSNPKFCNKSCAASFNNRKSIKRARSKVCHYDECDELILSSRKYCKDHRTNTNGSRVPIGKMTKGELIRMYGYSGAQSRIRRHSRDVFHTLNLPLKCFVCEYPTFVEIAHLRPVSDFGESTIVEAINDTKNLVPLCPNHHKEYDAGIIEL